MNTLQKTYKERENLARQILNIYGYDFCLQEPPLIYFLKRDEMHYLVIKEHYTIDYIIKMCIEHKQKKDILTGERKIKLKIKELLEFN